MVVWDTSTEPPVLVHCCDECGQVCDNDIDLDGKNYCNKCLDMFTVMNNTYFGGGDYEEG